MLPLKCFRDSRSGGAKAVRCAVELEVVAGVRMNVKCWPMLVVAGEASSSP